MTGGRTILTGIALFVLGGSLAAPALAGTGLTIPEPTGWTLLAMGLAGLIIGRQGSRRPPEE